MPGIKLAGTLGSKFNFLGLAVVALLFIHPALAEESGASPQTLDQPERSGASLQTLDQPDEAPIAAAPLWHDDTGTGDDETTAEASPNDVWQRIRNGFRVDEDASKNPLVAVHESWFAARPENVRRLAERSRPYLYYIVEELDRRAMPMEIALLPMIESAFNPKALSASAAAGIWQFIPSTGRHYGLRQDTWYDGRGDFAAATNAALDYLGKLYLDFGDWQLALAAYNCGEGCVARAIRSNIEQGLPSDYASLSLPNETRHYVPKLLALKNLISESERHGIAIEQLPDQPYFNQVTIHANMDIHAAARLADMSSDEFIALNAAFPRKLIRSDTPVKLLVPVGKADTFQRNLESGSWDTWQPYPAQKGERPAALAKRFDVSLARLEEHNQLHTKNGKLVRAQTILVPVKARGEGVAEAQSPFAAMDASRHVMLRDDLLLPASLKVSVRKTAQPVRYTIKRGDTLHAIARRFDVSLGDIKAWNPAFRNSSKIRTGEAVVVSRP